MSPIKKPSALDLQGTTCGAELPSLFAVNDPRVSTQKIPHHTLLKSFGPPLAPLQEKAGFPKKRAGMKPPTENTSLWTQFGQSSLMTESLGLKKKRFVGRKSDQKSTAGQPSRTFIPDRELRQHVSGKDPKRRSFVAEKSYDHEVEKDVRGPV